MASGDDREYPLAPRTMHVIDYGQYIRSPYTFTPYEPRLSDADVERIARRLAELMRAPDYDAVDVDVPPGYWERMRALLARAPIIVDDAAVDDAAVDDEPAL